MEIINIFLKHNVIDVNCVESVDLSCTVCLPCIRYGEIVNINLVRDKDTGKSKGFAFVCYEDQRSTILAVDNLNGAKVKSF